MAEISEGIGNSKIFFIWGGDGDNLILKLSFEKETKIR